MQSQTLIRGHLNGMILDAPDFIEPRQKMILQKARYKEKTPIYQDLQTNFWIDYFNELSFKQCGELLKALGQPIKRSAGQRRADLMEYFATMTGRSRQ